jgi:hypothetical protein
MTGSTRSSAGDVNNHTQWGIRMTDTNILRLGGISGLLFLILFIPSYLTAPDSPTATLAQQDLINYFNARQGEILALNGLLLIFAAFFFLLFLGVLHSALQRAEGERYGVSSIVLAGGLLFLAVMLAGAAVEIMHPATQARFQNFRADAQLGYLSLGLSGWMYRFAFAGMAALIAATSFGALGTGFLPKWLVWAGFAAALVALTRYVGPLGGWLALLWIAVVSVLMITGAIGRSVPAQDG